jgi:hypothetical protein
VAGAGGHPKFKLENVGVQVISLPRRSRIRVLFPASLLAAVFTASISSADQDAIALEADDAEEENPDLVYGDLSEAERAEIHDWRVATGVLPLDRAAPRDWEEIFFDSLAHVDPFEVSDTIYITAQLRIEPVPEYSTLRTLPVNSRERADFIANISSSVDDLIVGLTPEIEAAGAVVTSTSWLAHSVSFSVRAINADFLFGHPDVETLSVNIVPQPTNLNYDGNQLRNALLANEFITAGFDANNGNIASSTNPVRIAIVEWTSLDPDHNVPHRNHVGWKDAPGGASRLVEVSLCNFASCTPTSLNIKSSGPQELWHANWTSWAAAGSIEQGQDGAYPGSNTSAQRSRSGIAKEAEVLALLPVINGTPSNGLSADAFRIAIERAVEQSVDIISISASFFGEDSPLNCADPNKDFGTVNQAIRNATAAGTLFVVGAGNSGVYFGNNCSVGYPAIRPEVMTIGATTTTGGNPFYNQGVAAYSSRGNIPTTVYLFGSSVTSGVDLLAPGGVFDGHFHPPSNSGFGAYLLPGHPSLEGTSFAAPAVSGVAALMKHALLQTNFSAHRNHPGRVKAVLSVMGDKYLGGTTGTDFRSGYGRLRAHFDSSASMGSSRAMMIGTTTLSHGQILNIPINGGLPLSAANKGVKVAVNWFEDDYLNVSDIVLSVQNVCSGTPITTLAYDSSTSLTKSVKLGASGGKCPRIRIAVNASQTSRAVNWAIIHYSDIDPYDY